MASACRSIPTASPLSNDFLKKIEDDGTWTELWQICIGDRTGDTNVPELPEVGA